MHDAIFLMHGLILKISLPSFFYFKLDINRHQDRENRFINKNFRIYWKLQKSCKNGQFAHAPRKPFHDEINFSQFPQVFMANWKISPSVKVYFFKNRPNLIRLTVQATV